MTTPFVLSHWLYKINPCTFRLLVSWKICNMFIDNNLWTLLIGQLDPMPLLLKTHLTTIITCMVPMMMIYSGKHLSSINLLSYKQKIITLKDSDLLILCMYNKIIKIMFLKHQRLFEASEWYCDGTSDCYDVLIIFAKQFFVLTATHKSCRPDDKSLWHRFCTATAAIFSGASPHCGEFLHTNRIDTTKDVMRDCYWLSVRMFISPFDFNPLKFSLLLC